MLSGGMDRVRLGQLGTLPMEEGYGGRAQADGGYTEARP